MRTKKNSGSRRGWIFYRAEEDCEFQEVLIHRGELIALRPGDKPADGFSMQGRTNTNSYMLDLDPPAKGQSIGRPIIRVDKKPATKTDADFRGIPLVEPYDMHSHLFRVCRIEGGRKVRFVDESDAFYYLSLRLELFNEGKQLPTNLGRYIWMIREFAEFRELGGNPSDFWPYLHRGFEHRLSPFAFGAVKLPGPVVIDENRRLDEILLQQGFPKKAELGETTDPDLIDRFCEWLDGLLEDLQNRNSNAAVIEHLMKVLGCGKSVATSLHMLRMEFAEQHPPTFQKSTRGRKAPKMRRLPL